MTSRTPVKNGKWSWRGSAGNGARKVGAGLDGNRCLWMKPESLTGRWSAACSGNVMTDGSTWRNSGPGELK